MAFQKAFINTNYSENELYTLMYNAEHQEDARVGCIQGAYCETLDGFFRTVSAALRFPDYFGMNWDAFDECITDLEWLKFTGLLIVIDRADRLFVNEKNRKRQEFYDLMIKHLQTAFDYWNDRGVKIGILLNTPAE